MFTSVDTNHAERDKHLRSDDFNVASTNRDLPSVTSTGEGTADINGDLTLNGVTAGGDCRRRLSARRLHGAATAPVLRGAPR
jgi:hypothetical protein